MNKSAYITLMFFLMLFIYTSFGDSSIQGWNVFYWVVLSMYAAVLSYEQYVLSIARNVKFIMLLSCVYWCLFGLLEIIALLSGNYFEIIGNTNLWLSRSMIVIAGLILFHFKFYKS